MLILTVDYMLPCVILGVACPLFLKRVICISHYNILKSVVVT